jgi:hypothetical protein
LAERAGRIIMMCVREEVTNWFNREEFEAKKNQIGIVSEAVKEGILL